MGGQRHSIPPQLALQFNHDSRLKRHAHTVCGGTVRLERLRNHAPLEILQPLVLGRPAPRRAMTQAPG